jgi:hypothetical protein
MKARFISDQTVEGTECVSTEDHFLAMMDIDAFGRMLHTTTHQIIVVVVQQSGTLRFRELHLLNARRTAEVETDHALGRARQRGDIKVSLVGSQLLTIGHLADSLIIGTSDETGKIEVDAKSVNNFISIRMAKSEYGKETPLYVRAVQRVKDGPIKAVSNAITIPITFNGLSDYKAFYGTTAFGKSALTIVPTIDWAAENDSVQLYTSTSDVDQQSRVSYRLTTGTTTHQIISGDTYYGQIYHGKTSKKDYLSWLKQLTTYYGYAEVPAKADGNYAVATYQVSDSNMTYYQATPFVKLTVPNEERISDGSCAYFDDTVMELEDTMDSCSIKLSRFLLDNTSYNLTVPIHCSNPHVTVPSYVKFNGSDTQASIWLKWPRVAIGDTLTFTISMNGGCNIYNYNKSIEMKISGSNWKTLGTGQFADNYYNYTSDVTILENKDTAGLYKVVAPYKHWNGGYKASNNNDMIIEASDTSKIYFRTFNSGVYLSNGYGTFISFVQYYLDKGYSLDQIKQSHPDCFGTLKDGVITFPDNSVICSNNNSLYDWGAFTVTLPGHSTNSAKTNAAAKARKKNGESNGESRLVPFRRLDENIH